MTRPASVPAPSLAGSRQIAHPEILLRGTSTISGHASEFLAASSRAALGLPTDRPVVMSGHQASLWHCGILAKWFALRPISARASAHAAWLVVDHDTNDPTTIAYPSRTENGLGRGAWKWGRDASLGDDSPLPIRLRAARAPAAPPERDKCWSQDTLDALLRTHAALAANATVSNLAEQVTLASCQLLEPLTPVAPSIVFARRLASTPMFQALLRTMLKDPVACVEAYNKAARRFPAAGVRPLECKLDRVELPLWSIQRSRKPVIVSDRDSTGQDIGPSDTLAPRALLLSAVLRLGVCDLFIHGTGGGEYDKVTDAWMAEWLMNSHRDRAFLDADLRELLDQRANCGAPILAPSIVVSATVRLEFPEVAVPSPKELEHTIWLAHSAKHRLLARSDGAFDAARKQSLVDAIALARLGRRGAADVRESRAAALAAYRELHAALAASRLEHAATLADYDQRARTAKEARGLASIVHDRTWPFALHPIASLRSLRDAMEATL